ncbi:MAG: WYL domain-containing protein [Solirubrobacteraceae bacterium]|nr:WYL domain-containing protein [Solirubrobacteraceae bacterium]
MSNATSTRLLELLGHLQSQPVWSGAELAERLGVTGRTLRNDVDRLRAIGYPVDATRGPGGGYRLGREGRLPPLLLSDDEAVAVAVSLTSLDAVPGLADAGQTALSKLQRTLPDHLRRRVDAVASSTDVGPADTGSNVEQPRVDPEVLSRLAAAIGAREGVRFSYDGDDGVVTADPHRLVSWQGRWYLVARRRPGGELAVFRTDWMALRSSGASRFRPEPLEDGDYASFVVREVASTGWKVHARVLVDAPADEVLARINPAVGVVEPIDDHHSMLVTGADSYEVVAVWIGMLGLDFHVSEPPALVEHLRALAERYVSATP